MNFPVKPVFDGAATFDVFRPSISSRICILDSIGCTDFAARRICKIFDLKFSKKN